MKERKITKDIFPFLIKVLKREKLPYKSKKVDNSFLLKSNISSRKFHKVIMRAMCEREEKKAGIPVYTKAEYLKLRKTEEWKNSYPHVYQFLEGGYDPYTP